MKQFKGTKGPWQITDTGDISISLNGGSIDVWQLEGEPREEIEANAKAIEALPDLIEALQSMVGVFTPTADSSAEQQQEDALAKAEKALNEAL